MSNPQNVIDLFESLVAQTVDTLPEIFVQKLDNVNLTVAPWPTQQDLADAKAAPGHTLFGLYRGIPHTQRGLYFGATPDNITIFAGPLLRSYGFNPHELKKQIRKTVLHEIGHHFGMSEDEIRSAQTGSDNH